jgi:hypothetical protein
MGMMNVKYKSMCVCAWVCVLTDINHISRLVDCNHTIEQHQQEDRERQGNQRNSKWKERTGTEGKSFKENINNNINDIHPLEDASNRIDTGFLSRPSSSVFVSSSSPVHIQPRIQ